MKYFSILGLLVLTGPDLQAQMDDESTLAFQPELDRLLINAWNCGAKEVDVIMYPYHHQEWKHNEKENASWCFVNDSIVIEQMQNRTYFGIRRGNYIMEYDPETKKEVEYPCLVRDSLQYRIYENTWRWNKNKSWNYEKDICDTVADSCLNIRISSDGFISRNRSIRMSDSSNYQDYLVIRADSVYSESEWWRYSSSTSDHNGSRTLYITKTLKGYSICQIDTSFYITTYVYDGKDRLSYLHKLEYNSCHTYPNLETNELFVTYRDDYSRRNARKIRRTFR